MGKGIPVVTYNADGEYVNGQPQIGTNRLCYVGQSLYSSGQSMGQQIKLAVPGGGDIVIFTPVVGTGNTQPRADGAKSVLGSSYNVTEIATGAERVRGARGHEGVPERAQVHAEGRVRRRLR